VRSAKKDYFIRNWARLKGTFGSRREARLFKSFWWK